MKKENYQIIAEILLAVEGSGDFSEVLFENLHISHEDYQKAKQDFNKYGKSLR